jgi:hypothetical protein
MRKPISSGVLRLVGKGKLEGWQRNETMKPRTNNLILAVLLSISFTSIVLAQEFYEPPPRPVRPPVEFEEKPYEENTTRSNSGGKHEAEEYEPLSLKQGPIDVPPNENEETTPLENERITYQSIPQVNPAAPLILTAAPKFIVYLPKGKEYEDVFKEPYTAKAQSEIDNVEYGFKSLMPGNVDIFNDTSSKLLLAEIRNSKGRPVVIVAHSIGVGDSQVIKLPNGETLSVADIHRAGIESGSPCIVVTCNSTDIGLDRKISLTEAYYMCDYAVRAYNEGKAKTSLDLVYYMRKEATSWKLPVVTVSVMVISGGEAVLYTYAVEVDTRLIKHLPLMLICIGGVGFTGIISYKLLTRRGLKMRII